ncbi:CopG family transcriptional regulator [Enhydrobacter aerosaccus]|uniref:CopG family transcriptional regulator n=1 Tax=Enhydrobacter aerosaccus TaxID=225324 RepID=A0ABR5IJ36_9HYPH|nr:CopG family transcriptional regulator [Enhydrobacter aerosaccus]KND17685.1 CopG family transcriptional regulator [Enhydrobacter aerosaccus]
MSVITLRVTDDKHERIKNLAVSRGVSVNKLIDEAMTLMIAKYDIETRFKARAAKGNINAGLALLDKVLEKREAYDKKLESSVSE